MKAWLIEIQDDYPYSHDLIEISQELEVPDKHLQYFPELNTVYISSRYPGSVDEKPENIEELIDNVEDSLEWTRKSWKTKRTSTGNS